MSETDWEKVLDELEVFNTNLEEIRKLVDRVSRRIGLLRVRVEKLELSVAEKVM